MTDDGREALRQAAEWLSEHNWVQGGLYEKSDGTVGNALPSNRTEVTGACAVGAVAVVCGYQMGNVWDRATDLLGGLVDEAVVPTWNDHPSRTKEDVILALKKAAEL